MLFLHPETTCLKKWIPVIISPWHIFFFQCMPELISLICICHLLCIHLMLKFIHTGHIRNNSKPFLKMRLSILVGRIFEKIIHPGICQILHRHRMNLRYFRCWKSNLIRHTVSCSRIGLKGMSCFVCQNIHICGSSVKIGENKRSHHIRQKCTISPLHFTWLCFKIK